jgi:hypothetical protein
MPESITKRIIGLLTPSASGLKAADVRIGLGYTCVRLSNGNAGLAWTAKSSSETCTHELKAGTLAGSTALELLQKLDSEGNPLARSIGLAAANALAVGLPRPVSRKEDTLDIINIKSDDRVVMVGYFGPLITAIRMTGCRLDIVELKTGITGVLTPDEGKKALAECTVAIITGTSIVTNTIDELLSSLGRPRAAVILGPSTFMLPQVFAGTPVTHLAGAWVMDADRVVKIVSEGGGTMILKKHMSFETICLNQNK